MKIDKVMLVLCLNEAILTLFAGHHHDHDHHSHDHTHDPGVSSVSIVCEGSLDLDKVGLCEISNYQSFGWPLS